jgi:hypothetical protein
MNTLREVTGTELLVVYDHTLAGLCMWTISGSGLWPYAGQTLPVGPLLVVVCGRSLAGVCLWDHYW